MMFLSDSQETGSDSSKSSLLRNFILRSSPAMNPLRDLKDLQRAGVPSHYDKKARSYTIDPKFFLPAPRPCQK